MKVKLLIIVSVFTKIFSCDASKSGKSKPSLSFLNDGWTANNKNIVSDSKVEAGTGRGKARKSFQMFLKMLFI